ncbi:MAG: recombination regulator RecX [Lachnospiraceae bacterium]|nr:recombination regulator RecX [Lachnospiraceae bacterium]
MKIKEGAELSEETYLQIVKGILPKRAKLRAMNLLKSRSYTEYQLKKKLLDTGYADSICEEAVAYVKSFGYINDREYAISYINEAASVRSRREIFQKLQQKGIQKSTLDAVFSDIYGETESGDESSFDEIAVIVKALKKRGFTGNESYEEKQKLLAYFYRRGFEMDKVYRAMDKCLT